MVETGAVYQLDDEGKSMRADPVLHYVITDYYRKDAKKGSVPVELMNEKTTCDKRRYIELLAEVGNSVIESFGYKIIDLCRIV